MNLAADEGSRTGPPVVLQPGDELQAAVEANPPGTTFLLRPGLYREQRLVPKDGQGFIADGEAILNGARVMSGWRRDGAFWVLEGLPEPRPVGTTTRDPHRLGPPEVLAREVLFLDGELYRRVAELSELGPGLWYRDGDRAIMTDDPTGRVTEVTVTPEAFDGKAADVLLQGLIIEKYASDSHAGAIEGRKGWRWRLENVVARFNHSMGLRTGEGFVVEGGSYSDNGQIGIVVPRDDTVIRGAELCRNNNLGHARNWEAGGIKVFNDAEGFVIEDSIICDNNGSGIWTDGSTRNPVIRRNRVYDNVGTGIHLELTYGGLAAENYVANNATARRGKRTLPGTRGSQIQLTQTSNAEVRDNLVIVPADAGNGIGLYHYERGPWITVNNRIHHNRIVYLGESGRTGSYAKNDAENLRDNIFDHNTYIVPDGSFERYWWFDDSERGYAELTRFGVEPNGKLIRASDPGSHAEWSVAD